MKEFLNFLKDKFSPVITDTLKDQIITRTEESFQDLKEINTILTEINKTGDLTTKQLNKLGNASFEAASKYGRKAADYLNEVQSMYDAGYKNAEQAAELSLLAQNTGDFDDDLARKYITVSDAAYQYSGNIEKLTALLDAQKQVADRNALSMEELTNATQASASQLSNLGISENEITALLGTGMISTEGSGEDIGHAINGIIMSLQKIKGETGFETEILDDNAIARVEERCRNLGIELTTVKNGVAKLRDPMEILKELAEVYNSLPDGSAKKAGILSDIGGTYRSDVLSGILSNWNLYEKMLEDYENASGSAMNDSMKSADSWEDSLNKLSNTWTDTVENIANSDAIIMMINGFNSLLSILNTVTDTLGSWGSIGIGAGLFAGLNGFDISKIFKTVDEDAASASKALQALSTAGNMFAAWAFTQALQLACTALDNYVHRLEYAKEDLMETQSELSSVKTQIEENDEKIKILSRSSLSITDKDDLQRLRDQNKELKIRQKYLEKQEETDLQKVSDLTKEKYFQKYGNTTKESIKQYKSLYTQEQPKKTPASSYLSGNANAPVPSYAAGQNNTLSTSSDSLANLIAKYDYYSQEKENAIQSNNAKDIEKYDAELDALEEKLISSRTELQGFADDLSAAGESSKELENIHAQIKMIDDQLLSPGENLINFIDSNALSESKKELIELANAGELTQDKLSKNFSNIDTYLKENHLTLSDLISVVKTYQEELYDSSNDNSSLSLSDAKIAVDGYQDNDTQIPGLLDEYKLLREILSDTGNIQQETYEKLLSCSSKYSTAIKTENGLITVNAAKLEQIAKSRQMDTKEAINQALAQKKQEWIQWNNNIENYNGTLLESITMNYDNIDALQDEITQYELLANSLDNVSSAFGRFQNAQSTNDQDMYDTTENAFQTLKDYSSNENSENYQKYNRDEFQEAAMLLMDADTYKKALNAETPEEYQQVIDHFLNSITPLFDENSANSASYLVDEINKITEAGDAPKSDEDWAKRLGISKDAFNALKQNANQYGFNDKKIFESYQLNTLDEYQSLLSNVTSMQEALNSITDQESNEYQKLSKDLEEAQKKYTDFTNETAAALKEAYASFSSSEESSTLSFSDYLKQSLNFDDNDIIGNIDVMLARINELQEQMTSLPISSAPYEMRQEEINEIWQSLNALGYSNDSVEEGYSSVFKRDLFRNTIENYKDLMKEAESQIEIMESSTEDSEEYETASNYLKELKSQMEELKEPVELRIQFHIDEIDTEISNLQASLKNASGSQEAHKIQMALKSAENEKNALEKSAKEITNSEDLISYQPKILSGKVLYEEDFSLLENLTPPSLHGKIEYSAVFPTLPPKNTVTLQSFSTKTKTPAASTTPVKSTESDGTFHAFSQGISSDISIQKSEKALVNELGEEGLVRNGKLYPIQGGAQFLNLKRGDIIFNHKQMEQLRKNGYTAGRGKLIGAHAKGTVYHSYKSGTGTDANTSIFPNITGQNSVISNGKDAASNNTTASPDKNAEKPFEQLFNWLERRLKNLQGKFDKWIKLAETALTGKFINKYYKKAAASIKKELNTYGKSYDFYMNKARETGLDESYAKKVRNGTLDLETINDENLAEQISNYQEWYDKATEATTSFLETAEKLYQLPLEKAAAKIELFNDAISLLDKKLDNAIGSAAKNSLIDQKTVQEKKTLNAQAKAKKESKKNLKSAAKDLKRADTLKDSGLNAKQKKKLKKAVNKREELDTSTLKNGSKSYKAAVKYNEALKAKKQANYEYSMTEEDYKSQLVEAAKAKFDNIADDYEKEVQKLDYKMTAVNNTVSEIEAAGKKVNKSYYESQKALNDQTLAQYQAEKAALEKSIAGIKKGTDEWYSAYDQIEQIASSISNCKKETYELNNAIQKLHFDLFDDIAASIGRIITEQDFLQSLSAHEKTTDSETGTLTDAGLAKLGSSTVSYYAAKSRSDKDAAMVKELQDMVNQGVLSNGKYTFNSIDDLEAKLKEMYGTWQNDIKETYSQQSAVTDIMKEQYKAQIDMVKDLIDAKKEALNAEKDLHSYQKSIQEKTNDISTIQKQIAAYSGDTSQEGLAKLQKLQKELADKQADLAEAEYDRYMSDQQDMLDKLYEEYDELVTKKLDDFMGLFQEGIDLSNENTSLISDYLSNIAEANGYIEETKGLFNGLADTIEKNIDNVIDSMVNKEIKKSGTASDASSNTTSGNSEQTFQAGWERQNPAVGAENHSSENHVIQTKSTKAEYLNAAKKYIRNHVSKTNKKESELSAVNKVIYQNTAKAYSGSGKILSEDQLKDLAKKLGVTYDGGGKKKNLYQKLKSIKFPGFKKGGIVSVDDIARQVRANGDDGIASVKNGEGFIPAEQTSQIQDLLKKLPSMNRISQSLTDLPDFNRTVSADINKPANIAASYYFTLENCNRAEDIIQQIQQSKKVQRALRSVTSDQLAESGRLSVKALR